METALAASGDETTKTCDVLEKKDISNSADLSRCFGNSSKLQTPKRSKKKPSLFSLQRRASWAFASVRGGGGGEGWSEAAAPASHRQVSRAASLSGAAKASSPRNHNNNNNNKAFGRLPRRLPFASTTTATTTADLGSMRDLLLKLTTATSGEPLTTTTAGPQKTSSTIPEAPDAVPPCAKSPLAKSRSGRFSVPAQQQHQAPTTTPPRRAFFRHNHKLRSKPSFDDEEEFVLFSCQSSSNNDESFKTEPSSSMSSDDTTSPSPSVSFLGSTDDVLVTTNTEFLESSSGTEGMDREHATPATHSAVLVARQQKTLCGSPPAAPRKGSLCTAQTFLFESTKNLMQAYDQILADTADEESGHFLMASTPSSKATEAKTLPPPASPVSPPPRRLSLTTATPFTSPTTGRSLLFESTKNLMEEFDKIAMMVEEEEEDDDDHDDDDDDDDPSQEGNATANNE